MTLDSRVKQLRKQLNISQEAFGTKLGVTGAGISKIENGQRNLTEQMIILICKEFNINERWLRYGDGEMFKEKPPFGMDQIAKYYDLDDLDVKIIQEYVSMNANSRKVIKEYIMKLAALGNDLNKNNDLERSIKGEQDHSLDKVKCPEGKEESKSSNINETTNLE